MTFCFRNFQSSGWGGCLAIYLRFPAFDGGSAYKLNEKRAIFSRSSRFQQQAISLAKKRGHFRLEKLFRTMFRQNITNAANGNIPSLSQNVKAKRAPAFSQVLDRASALPPIPDERPVPLELEVTSTNPIMGRDNYGLEQDSGQL